MSYGSWPRRVPGPHSSGLLGGPANASGWGVPPSSERAKDEALFNSLSPAVGMVTGEQVRGVFASSGLPQGKLAQIWGMVDRNSDGKINVDEFCMAMSLIRQAQQPISSSWSTQGFKSSSSSSSSSSQAPVLSGGGVVESGHSWNSTPSGFPAVGKTMAAERSPVLGGVGGVGLSVSLCTLSSGWEMKPQDRRRFRMHFNTLDTNKSGFLSGPEAREVLTKSKLSKHTLGQIWMLSDVDKDGCLSADEFAIAMHLIEKVKAGIAVPTSLPPELVPSANTASATDSKTSSSGAGVPDRKTSVPERKTSVPVSEDLSFEDRRKQNFERGRMELERRRKARQEQQEREAAEKERKLREEEERRLQQEHEAELAKQAELERQRRIALEIAAEREHQMQKLALQREAELKELERQRREEFARKRQKELIGQRDWERRTLQTLRQQTSELDQQLSQLEERKVAVLASQERQAMLCRDLSQTYRSLKLSTDIRREELNKLEVELKGFQSQLSVLQHQRRQLQESLQAKSPSTAAHQLVRKKLTDGTMGVAASLASLRAALKYTTDAVSKQRGFFQLNNTTLLELRSARETDAVQVRNMGLLVGVRRREWTAWQEAERAREEAERRAREEKERAAIKRQEQALREARLAKIKRDQEQALLKKQERDLEALYTPVGKPPKKNQEPAPLKKEPEDLDALYTAVVKSPRPPIATKPAVLLSRDEPPISSSSSSSSSAEKDNDAEVLKKVKELQQRKAQLQQQQQQQQKQKDQPSTKPPPSRPLPYIAHKLLSKDVKGKPDHGGGGGRGGTDPQLLDLMSSWDHTAQTKGISHFQKDTSQILEPLKGSREPSPAATEQPKPAPRTNLSPARQTEAEKSPPPPPEAKPKKTVAAAAAVSTEEKAAVKAVNRMSVTELSHMFEEAATFHRPVETASPPRQEEIPAVSSSLDQTAPVSGASDQAPVIRESLEQPQRTYEALYSYEAADESEVSLQEGESVVGVATQKAAQGWVMVEVAGGRQGWAPEQYLKELGGVSIEEPAAVEPVVEPSVKAQVLFSWKGSKDNHLTLEKGLVISVLEQNDKWWSGEVEGRVGWFPKTFVRLLDPEPPPPPLPQQQQQQQPSAPSVARSPEVTPVLETTPPVIDCEAVYDYEGQTSDDLSFKTGDIIQLLAQEGDWWTGLLNGVQGIFPSNYVQLRTSPSPSASLPVFSQLAEQPASGSSLPSSSSLPSVLPPSSSSSSLSSVAEGVVLLSKPLVVRVTVAFSATKESHLPLSLSDFVKVRKQAANGWWEGELQSRGKQRQAGWFPSNRVQPLSAHVHSTSSSAMRAKSPLLDALEDKPKFSASQNLVLALYTYNATSADELSFHKGSVLNVQSKEGDWWRGELNGQVGLFPSNYVQLLNEQQAPTSDPTRWADSVSPDFLVTVSDKERKRQEAIFELLSSERHYVDSLKLVKEVFFDPMCEASVLTEEERGKVIVNWDQLISCNGDLLSAFLVRLRTSGHLVRSIGDVLVNQLHSLTPHIRWCSNQLTACTLLQQKGSDPQFKEFEQRCMQDARTGGLPLSSYLLKPMQRVTKYPLLIKRIISYTPEGDLDSVELTLALDIAEELCMHVNEAVRQKENTEQLEWLQTHVQFTLDERLVFNSQTNFMGPRKLLHHGRLFKVRGGKDLVGFLFNDFFLLVKPKQFFARAATAEEMAPFGKNYFLMYRKPFLLEGLRAKKATSESYGGPTFLLLHPTEEKEIPLRVDSESKRDVWIKHLSQACQDYMLTKKRQERQNQEKYLRTLKDSVGLLRITVVEASDLVAKDPNGKSDPFCVIKLGDMQEQKTSVIQATLNPKWNFTMQFAVHDINTDVVEVSVFDKDLFSPNDFLGSRRIPLKELFREGDSPWVKRMLLHEVPNGEIELSFELQLNKSTLLL